MGVHLALDAGQLAPFNASYAANLGALGQAGCHGSASCPAVGCDAGACSSSSGSSSAPARCQRRPGGPAPLRRWRMLFGHLRRVLPMHGFHARRLAAAHRPATSVLPVKQQRSKDGIMVVTVRDVSDGEEPEEAAMALNDHEQMKASLLQGGSTCTRRRQRRPLQWLARLLHQLVAWVPGRLKPVGPGENDKNMFERVLNVATCVPFFIAGQRIYMTCLSAAGKRFGLAFLVVGAVATVYHASWGVRTRPAARKVDYWTIGASSIALSVAVLGLPATAAAAMALLIPFQPTLVTTTNYAAVEVKFLLLVLAQPSLAAAWARHVGLTLAATLSFALEDTPVLRWCPGVHSLFHVLSAGSFLTLSCCLTALEAPLPPAMPLPQAILGS